MELSNEAKKEIEDYSEIELFLFINSHGNLINEVRKKEAPEGSSEIDSIRDALNYAIFSTGKYGFLPYDSEGKPADPFYRWFKWWSSYIGSMPDETWNDLNKKIKDKEDISTYRPEGNWLDIKVTD
jgi:hypothetical protein